MQHHAIDHTLTFIHWLLIMTYWHLQFWHSRRSRIHKQPPEVFLKILQISQESTCAGVSFLQRCNLHACNVTKKDSYTDVFLWNLRNSEEHLFWRRYERLLLCVEYFIIYWFLQYTFFIFTNKFFYFTQLKQ